MALEADKKRQAVDALGGYAYQLWRTVEAWLDLPPDAQLVVEGAEDFDTILHGAATVTQV